MNKDDVFLIKKIYELSKKMNRSIKISTKDEAANIYAYLKGYSSWSEMAFYENKNNLSLTNEENSELDESSKSFSEKAWVFNNSFVKDLEKEERKENKYVFEKKSGKMAFSSIGTYTTLKSETPVSLISENALIYGMENENTFEFFQSEINKLINWNRSSIICGLDKYNENHKILIKMLKKQKALFIGKEQEIKINPMLDLFNLDVFEDFFSVGIGEENIFLDIWLNVIRIYHEQLEYKITPSFLKESLKIENLIQLMTSLEKNIQLQMKPLINYINKHLEIRYLKEKQTFIISEIAQNQHYKQIYKIEKKINDLLNLEKENIFDFEKGVSIFDIYKESGLIIILDVIDEYKETYWGIIFNLLNLVMKEQHNYLEKELLPEENYQAQIMVWDSAKIINCASMKIVIDNMDYWTTHLYDLSPENNSIGVENAREIFIREIKQVLFLRQNISKLNKLLESRIKEETSQWNINLFYLKFNILKTLKEDEAILWQYNTEEKVLKSLEDYQLKKIKLNYLLNENDD